MLTDYLKIYHLMRRNKNTFASNKFYFRFIRNSFLIISLTFFFVAVVGLILPDLVVINDESISTSGVTVITCLGALSLLLFFALKDKFAYAVIDSSKVIVISSKKRGGYSWSEVRIKQIPFLYPPLYKIILPDEKTLFFNTENKYVSFSFGLVIDLSDMGKLIKQKTSSPN